MHNVVKWPNIVVLFTGQQAWAGESDDRKNR